MLESAIEWLMRWNRRWSTKLKGTYTHNDNRHLLIVDAAEQTSRVDDHRQHQLRPELEVRYLLQDDKGSLFIVQRNQVARMFGSGDGSAELWGWDVSLGLLWSHADLLFVDAELAYSQTHCLTQSCEASQLLRPRLLLSMKL